MTRSLKQPLRKTRTFCCSHRRFRLLRMRWPHQQAELPSRFTIRDCRGRDVFDNDIDWRLVG